MTMIDTVSAANARVGETPWSCSDALRDDWLRSPQEFTKFTKAIFTDIDKDESGDLSMTELEVYSQTVNNDKCKTAAQVLISHFDQAQNLAGVKPADAQLAGVVLPVHNREYNLMLGPGPGYKSYETTFSGDRAGQGITLKDLAVIDAVMDVEKTQNELDSVRNSELWQGFGGAVSTIASGIAVGTAFALLIEGPGLLIAPAMGPVLAYGIDSARKSYDCLFNSQTPLLKQEMDARRLVLESWNIFEPSKS